MPGNPRECREHAANCRKLAATSNNETARQAFENLASTWEGLAKELEAAHVFLQTLNSIEAGDAVRVPGAPEGFLAELD